VVTGVPLGSGPLPVEVDAVHVNTGPTNFSLDAAVRAASEKNFE